MKTGSSKGVGAREAGERLDAAPKFPLFHLECRILEVVICTIWQKWRSEKTSVALKKLRIPHRQAIGISKRQKYRSLICNEDCQGYKSWNERLYLYDYTYIKVGEREKMKLSNDKFVPGNRP